MIAGSSDWTPSEADPETAIQVKVVYLGDPGVEKGVREGREDKCGVSSSRLPTWATGAQSGETPGENAEHASELPVPRC